MCLDDPNKYDGSVIDVGNEAIVTGLYDDGFSTQQMGRMARVFGDIKNVEVGEFVVLRATFHKPNHLYASAVRIAKKRRLKIWLSVIPAIIIVVLFFTRFHFDFKSFYFEEN